MLEVNGITINFTGLSDERTSITLSFQEAELLYHELSHRLNETEDSDIEIYTIEETSNYG
jgi:hypothetical protein